MSPFFCRVKKTWWNWLWEMGEKKLNKIKWSVKKKLYRDLIRVFFLDANMPCVVTNIESRATYIHAVGPIAKRFFIRKLIIVCTQFVPKYTAKSLLLTLFTSEISHQFEGWAKFDWSAYALPHFGNKPNLIMGLILMIFLNILISTQDQVSD